MDAIANRLRKIIGLDAATIGLGAIERAVMQRIAATNTASLAQYRRLLQDSAEELRALIDTLVVPETWFFRDRGAFAAVAAEAKAPRHSAKLRYLCVPCATGEEPLSLAMTLLDAGVPAGRFHIDAFDICERLLKHAERGVYGRNSFRGTDTEFRNRYFRETGEGCAIDSAVRKQTTFRQANLLDDSAFHGAQVYDAIFCRNLLIYFDEEARLKAIRKISQLLREDGLLCVAPAESGLLLRHGFAPASAPQSFAFRRDQKPQAAKSHAAAKPREHRPHAHHPAHKQPQPSHPAPAKAKEATPPLPSFEDAMRLADAGRYDEVSAICRAHIEAKGTSADAYYLLAIVSDASGRYEEAATLYRKAIYLDPRHRDALAHFSLLAERLGQTAAAGALRQRALRIESTAA